MQTLRPMLMTFAALVLASLASAASAAQTQVERGRYLASAGDCVSCHTAPGGKPYAGGRSINTGFGVIYSPNITPDRDTGIGKWSADDFWRAMHTGHDDEGKHLYPAFPYPWFTRATREDVDAIRAFLATVPPARQEDRAPRLSWWVRWRPLLAVWNALNFHEGEYKPDAQRSAQWNRGAYLVEGLGHCGACHTARGATGGSRGTPLEGSKLPDGWYANSLRGNVRDGLGAWSVDEIVEYLKTGSTARVAPAGEMSQVIANSTSHLTEPDLRAIAVYLKDLPADEDHKAKFEPLTADALRRGEGLFIDNCIGCHMADGHGVRDVFPPLAGSPVVQSRDPATVLRVILDGQRIVATHDKPTGLGMPGFSRKLDDSEVADVVNYIRNAWGNRGSLVKASDIAHLRRSLGTQSASR